MYDACGGVPQLISKVVLQLYLTSRKHSTEHNPRGCIGVPRLHHARHVTCRARHGAARVTRRAARRLRVVTVLVTVFVECFLRPLRNLYAEGGFFAQPGFDARVRLKLGLHSAAA